jgi:glycosyltransferase involved in cell wall biosynthesis
MKIIQINSVLSYGSTGRIAQSISETLDNYQIENYVFYGIGNSKFKNGIKIGGFFNSFFHKILTRIFGKHGFYSFFTTYGLIKRIKQINPDIIHLHNLHGHYLNVELLFNFFKKNNSKVFWTFHDCWPFTGHCTYFDTYKCDKWKTHCRNCPALREYPNSLIFDRSKESFIDKKQLFTSIKDLTIITPSKWLEDLVKQSFLKSFRTKVINNGIDLRLFHETKSNLVQKYGLNNLFIILGVASEWTRRKGLIYFIELSKILTPEFKIILIGLDENQIKSLPSNIIGLKKTTTIRELCEFYSTADVYVNPTLEDNFPTTNLESLACGTPVITFETGGSPEAIDINTGIVVKKDDLEGIKNGIYFIKNKTKNFYKNSCLKRANELFNKDYTYQKYMKLYGIITKNN